MSLGIKIIVVERKAFLEIYFNLPLKDSNKSMTSFANLLSLKIFQFQMLESSNERRVGKF